MLWKRIVEIGFHLLYNQLAWTYDVVSWAVSLGEWRKWQLASLEFVQGTAVLEIAHGPGHMLIEMDQRDFNVVGLDLSPAMGRLAQARLKRGGLESSIPLIRCQIPDIPLQPATFDTILSQFPTSFIFEAGTLFTLHRLLKPDGRLVILPEGHLTSQGLVSKFIHWLFYITGQTVVSKAVANKRDETAAVDLFWEDVKNEFAAAGFNAQIEIIALARSQATVIVAQKS